MRTLPRSPPLCQLGFLSRSGSWVWANTGTIPWFTQVASVGGEKEPGFACSEIKLLSKTTIKEIKGFIKICGIWSTANACSASIVVAFDFLCHSCFEGRAHSDVCLLTWGNKCRCLILNKLFCSVLWSYEELLFSYQPGERLVMCPKTMIIWIVNSGIYAVLSTFLYCKIQEKFVRSWWCFCFNVYCFSVVC